MMRIEQGISSRKRARHLGMRSHSPNVTPEFCVYM